MSAFGCETIVRKLGGRWNVQQANGMCRCPAHDDHTPSLSVSERDGRVLVYCHAGCPQDDVLDALSDMGFDIRCSDGINDVGHIDDYRHPELGKPSHTWPYYDAAGKLVGYIARFETKDGKTFRPLVLKGGRWRAEDFPKPYPLYNLPSLLSRPDALVLVSEGEKAAEAAANLFPDVVTTTAVHGAKSPGKSDWAPLKARSVSIWPDNDEAGANYAAEVAGLAKAAGAASVRIVRLPDNLPKGWDLADAPPEGLDPQAFLDTAPVLAEPLEHDRKSCFVTASDVTPMEVAWLWEPYLPLGHPAMIVGDPGVGKSMVALALAAAGSSGRPLPGMKAAVGPWSTLWLGLEDDLSFVVVPRYRRMGGDPDRLTCYRPGTGHPLDAAFIASTVLPEADCIAARLIVIDTVLAWSPGNVNDSKYIRQIVRTLAPLCVGRTVLLLHHNRKTGADRAIHRVAGSMQFSASVRSVLTVQSDAGASRVLAHAKSNFGSLGESRQFSIVHPGKLIWGDVDERSADQLADWSNGEERSAVEDAVRLLRDLLRGGPVVAKDVQKEARAAGIAERTLQRAKTHLGIKSTKLGQPGGSDQKWCWALPEGCQESLEDGLPAKSGNLRGSDSNKDCYINNVPEGGQPREDGCLRGDPDLMEERAAREGVLSRGKEEQERAAAAGQAQVGFGFEPDGEPAEDGRAGADVHWENLEA